MLRFFAIHPTAANLLMLVLILLGLNSLPDLKRETFPDFSINAISVTVVYPGARPESIESALCIPMEDAVDGLSNIDKVTCEATEGLASLTVEMEEGGDFSKLMTEVKNEIDGIDTFPEDAEAPFILEANRTDEVINLAIHGKNMSNAQLKEYSESIKRKLKQEPGVSLIDIQGFSTHQLQVEVSLPLLRQVGLSISDLSDALSNQNIEAPSGELKDENRALLIRVDQQEVTAEKLGRTVVSASEEGGQILLSDIAIITDKFELEEDKIWQDGERIALLKINKNKSQDAINIAKTVRDFVDREQSSAPIGISFVLSNDQSTNIVDRLIMLLENGGQGIILAFIVMWLFFSWRYAFWVAMGLPVSFLGALWLMSIFGVSVNMISMVAMLIAIGLLMDDAIVIAENIASQVALNNSIDDGVIKGVTLVFPGVVSSFLTTLAIFGGMAFISGNIGQVLRDIPIVLILTLTVSLIEAFLILPHHLAHALHGESGKDTKEGLISGLKNKFVDAFERFRNKQLVNTVEAIIRFRYLFVGSLIGMLFISVSLMVSGTLAFKAFPNTEADILDARILMPPGTSLVQTEKVVNHVVASVKKMEQNFAKSSKVKKPLIEHITVEFNKNADAFISGAHVATVQVEFLTVEEREQSIYEIEDAWKSEIGEVPGVVSLSLKEPAAGPAGLAIDIQLQATDMAQMLEAGNKIVNEINTYMGVSNVMLDVRPGKQELELKLMPGALSLGVNAATLSDQIGTAFNGVKIDDIQRGSEQLEIELKLSKQDSLTQSQLEQFPITLSDGSEIPLSALVEFNYERGFSRINRINGLRTLSVIGDVDDQVLNTNVLLGRLTDTILKEIEKDYPNMKINLEGENKEGNETSSSIVSKFMMGLVGIFIILSFQFRSYIEPAIVMLAIPLALIGALWGHLILGYDMTMPSMIGFVSLAGIVVNDSILLVEYIKQHIADGVPAHKAAVNASKARFRAVFITSATTIAGLVPLMFETSTQAQIMQPMVVSIIFGMITSTCLILFLLPSFYVILDDFGLVKKHADH
ncbi:acriflavin resistance protein [Marinomonas sp. 42_23_T18]|nr:acriflavin resistance protein [Marinomonas sp. 42_23_T18]